MIMLMNSVSLRSRKEKKNKMISMVGSKLVKRVVFEQEYKIKLRKKHIRGQTVLTMLKRMGGKMSVDLNATILVTVTCQELLSLVTKNDLRIIFVL